MKKYIKSTISKLKDAFSFTGLIRIGNWFCALAYLGSSIRCAIESFEKLFKYVSYIIVSGIVMIYTNNDNVHQDIVTICQCILDVVTILSK